MPNKDVIIHIVKIKTLIIERAYTMEKNVQIDMASNKSTAYENYAEIKKAVESAAMGLYSKYDVQILNVFLSDNKKVIMKLRIPDDIVENFSIGNHMRGVAFYLLKNYNEKYSELVVGKRLLIYTVIPTPTEKEDNISFDNKLSAISKFIDLLKNDDEESKAKISQIIAVLYGEED